MLRKILVVLLCITAVQNALANSHYSKVVFSDKEFSVANTQLYLDKGFIFLSTKSFHESDFVQAVFYGCPTQNQQTDHKTLYVCEAPLLRQTARFQILLPIASPADQLKVANKLIPQPSQLKKSWRIGILFSARSEGVLGSLKSNLPDSMSVTSLRSFGALRFSEQLDSLMKNSDVILALQDASIFNSSTQRALILNSYRNGKPVIGPNKQFVSSGSILTLDVTETDLVKASIKRLNLNSINKSYESGIYFPLASNILINKDVFNAFNIDIPNQITLNSMLMALDSEGALNNE